MRFSRRSTIFADPILGGAKLDFLGPATVGRLFQNGPGSGIIQTEIRFPAALADIGETTRQVHQKISSSKSGTVADVFAAAAEDVCKSCAQKAGVLGRTVSFGDGRF